MDVSACLTELRGMTEQHRGGLRIDMDRYVELVASLDQWMSKGGHLPSQWPVPAGLVAPPF